MTKNILFKRLLLASSLVLAANAMAADTIKIVLAGPTTGPLTQYGDMQNIGAQMAIEQINAKGGVNGKKLEAVIMDDACEPKQAVTVANKVINDGYHFVIGHLCSGATLPAAALYNEEGILMISGASTSPELSAKGYKTIFRTIGLDTQQAPVAAKYIAEKIKPKAVAIINDKQQYGQGLAEGVDKALKADGVNVVAFEAINKGQQDFSALITKLKSLKVDFVYYGGYHPELGLILRQSGEQGFNAKFMGPEGVGNPDISAIAGKYSENLLVTLPADFASLPENAKLVAAFKKEKKDYKGPFVMTSYAAVQVIAETANALKSDDPAKIAKEMRKMTYNTPIGKIGFTDKGDLKEFAFIVYHWHTDGSKTQAK